MKFAKAWNKRKVLDRVKLAHASDLEGKIGSASWDDLTKDEQRTLIGTILKLSARYQRRWSNRVSKTYKMLGVSKR